MPAVRAVFIDGPQASVGRVLVYHRVHAARGYTEEEPRTPQLLEVAVVAVPVGLRHDGHAIACGFEATPHDGHAERRVIDVGITREQDDVELVPPLQCAFLLRRREEIRQFICFCVQSDKDL